jgi:arylsulfatase
MLGKPGAKSPHEALVFYAGEELQAVRSGDWKLHFAHPYLTVAAAPGRHGKPSNWENLTPASITQSGLEGIASRHGYRVEKLELSLFNLRDDPGETRNVAAEHPDVVRRLQALVAPLREELGDTLTGAQGRAIRPAARFAAAPPGK